MDQDASSEGEDLNADLHNFDETCRLLQARSEKRLQKVKSARAAENEDIELKKLALQELKAKHNEELQPLEAALQSGHARKRKHEEEIQQLEHRISDFKSWKPNSEELPVRLLLFSSSSPSISKSGTVSGRSCCECSVYLFGDHCTDACTRLHELTAFMLRLSSSPQFLADPHHLYEVPIKEETN